LRQILKNKKVKIISTEEVLKDIIPINWDEDNEERLKEEENYHSSNNSRK